MKFQIYSRKSLFTGKGESIENQIQLCKDYITREFPQTQKDDIYIFEDEGFSGKNLERPKFQEMIKQQSQIKIDYVVVYRLDRISRNVGDFSNLMDSFREKEIGFISINEKFDTSTPMGRAMITIAAVFAQLERETIAERVKDNMYQLAKTGRWLGGTTPTGYDSVIDESCIDANKEPIKRLEFNKDINIVKRIYTLFLETHSIVGTVKKTIEEGIVSFTGRNYSLQGVKQILQNPAYCIGDEYSYQYFINKNALICFNIDECNGEYGLMSYGKRDYTKKTAVRQDEEHWTISLGKHKGIIRGEDWVEVQKILERNKPTSKNKPQKNGNSLLSGMIICKKCGNKMFAKNHSGNSNIFYYMCKNKMIGGTKLCDCKNLKGNEIDQQICNYILNYAEDKSVVKESVINHKNNIDSSAISEYDLNCSRIKSNEAEIEKLMDKIIKEDISSVLLSKIDKKINELTELNAQLEARNIELANIKNDIANDINHIELLESMLHSFKTTFEHSSLVQKREAIRCLINRIEWDGKDLSVFMWDKQ